MKITEIIVKPPFIKLEQFLKLTGETVTGGQAKIIIQNGEIKVNNIICYERGKKLYSGDVVEMNKDSVFSVKIN